METIKMPPEICMDERIRKACAEPGAGVIYMAIFANGKGYIGQTWDWNRRLKEHKAGHSGCRYFRYALRKHGAPYFFEPISCLFSKAEMNILRKKGWTGKDFQREMDEMEVALIALYKTMSPNGYNLTEGGRGGKMSPESKEKHRAAMREYGKRNRGENNPATRPEVRAKMAKAWVKRKARGFSPQELANRAAAQCGRKHSEETKAKMRRNMKGLKRSEEAKANIRAAMQTTEMRELRCKNSTGRRHTEEAKAKMSAAHKGKALSAAHRANLSVAGKGKNKGKKRPDLAARNRARKSAKPAADLKFAR